MLSEQTIKELGESLSESETTLINALLVSQKEKVENLIVKQASTKHNSSCKMAFGKPSKHSECPRCEELKRGMPSREGWQKSYYAKKKQVEHDWQLRLKNHDCKTNGCGPICVAFDW